MGSPLSAGHDSEGSPTHPTGFEDRQALAIWLQGNGTADTSGKPESEEQLDEAPGGEEEEEGKGGGGRGGGGRCGRAWDGITLGRSVSHLSSCVACRSGSVSLMRE